MFGWIPLCSCVPPQVFGKVRELAINTSESRPPQRLLNHLLELARYKTLQPAKAQQLQHVAEPLDLPAAERCGFGVASYETQLSDPFHVDTAPNPSFRFHPHQGDGDRRAEQVG